MNCPKMFTRTLFKKLDGTGFFKRKQTLGDIIAGIGKRKFSLIDVLEEMDSHVYWLSADQVDLIVACMCSREMAQKITTETDAPRWIKDVVIRRGSDLYYYLSWTRANYEDYLRILK